MLTTILTILALPFIAGIPFMFFGKPKLPFKNFAAVQLFCFIITMIMYYSSYNHAVLDTEIWHGKITNKQKVSVSCEHSYSCNCRTEVRGSGKDTYFTTVCDTCYEHTEDFNWELNTDTGDTILVPRVDRQGAYTPARWEQSYVSEPVAIKKYFTNYIKAVPDTVLTRQVASSPSSLPVPKPTQDIYDLYRVDKYITVGFTDENSHHWNWLLSNLNGTYGHSKQISVSVIAVKTNDTNYSYKLEAEWLGGKQNELIVLVGSPSPPNITWVKVISWTKNEKIKTNIKDKLLDIGTLNKRDEIIEEIENEIKLNWERRRMREFEYLMLDFQPSTGALFLTSIILTILSVFLYITLPNGHYTQSGLKFTRRNFIRRAKF